ncbi:polysaccharide pyruvyl transferase family protein [Alkalicoccus halolimnae]|uniref:Polysaccharide pyruvyl transferase family protein n=1 Tax=Alkalicoccus halolimnae TaxID=1667239 RepID=A0A5C7FLP9_9BACI|nr:polysaccharide pyruvyl transferase family protein [Alkalicoccus halolimnae]TXF87009.1 polysaccharide pyruvyl transferase family protein [Alkalicoccus halolimnae]
MKTVSLIYTYGLKNSGDMAINLGAFDLLLDLGVRIKAFSKSDETDIEYQKSKHYINEYYPTVQLFGGPFKYNRDEGKLKSISNHFNGYIKTVGLNEDQKFIQLLTSSDFIIFNGGNLLRSESLIDYARLRALMYPLKKAYEKKVPYIMLPHSASVINKRGKKLLSSNLNEAKQIFTREDKSYQYLSEMFPESKIEESIDLAFFIKDNDKAKQEFQKKYNDTFNKTSSKIAFTLRTQVVGDLGELSTSKKNEILDVIRKTLEHYISKSNYEVILIVQTRKDINVTQQIYNEYKSTGRITFIEEYDTLVLREIYRNCNLLIGMRLHSIILALSTNTPSIGYFEKQWGFKNPGLMEKFELPYKLVEDKATDLIEESSEVLDNISTHKIKIMDTIEKEEVKIKTRLKSLFIEKSEIMKNY